MSLNKTKTVNENPFYNRRELFSLYQNGTKSSISSMLDEAWRECVTKEGKELFHSICFSIGDITNREHNIFRQKHIKAEGGGNSAVSSWIEYLTWLINKDEAQFIKFLPLIVEYVGLRELTTYQIKTEKFKKNVSSIFGLLPLIQSKESTNKALIDLLESFVRGNNPFQKMQVAKFCHIPRYSKRIKTDKEGNKLGMRELQLSTKNKMKAYEKLITDLSMRMGWEIKVTPSYTNFIGYRTWQKEYNGELEYVLFATKKILDFDQEQFLVWLNQLPSGARYAVKRRIMDGEGKLKDESYSKLYDWYNLWEKAKLDAQQEKRELEVKAQTQVLSEEDKAKLAKVSKEAKVTTGGKSLADYVTDFTQGKVDDITVDAIVSKTKFEVPVLVVADCSGSMSGRPTNVARLLTTLALTKNPLNESLLICFGTTAKVYTDGSEGWNKSNRFMQGQSVKVGKLVDKTKKFMTNYTNISNFVNSDMGGTTFASVAKEMDSWVGLATNEAEKKQRIEQINQYPVFLVVTDGDFNSDRSQAQSLMAFRTYMLQKFGWDGVVVVWDVPKSGDGSNVNKSGYYDSIPNTIHITTFNISVINSIFTKIDDLDVIDIYTPLKSLHMMERYRLVREATN